MATDDPSDQPLGFDIDIGEILKDVTRSTRKPARRRTLTAKTAKLSRS